MKTGLSRLGMLFGFFGILILGFTEGPSQVNWGLAFGVAVACGALGWCAGWVLGWAISGFAKP